MEPDLTIYSNWPEWSWVNAGQVPQALVHFFLWGKDDKCLLTCAKAGLLQVSGFADTCSPLIFQNISVYSSRSLEAITYILCVFYGGRPNMKESCNNTNCLRIHWDLHNLNLLSKLKLNSEASAAIWVALKDYISGKLVLSKQPAVLTLL